MSDAAAHAALTLARSKAGFFEDGSRAGKSRRRAKRVAVGPRSAF